MRCSGVKSLISSSVGVELSLEEFVSGPVMVILGGIMDLIVREVLGEEAAKRKARIPLRYLINNKQRKKLQNTI